MDATAFADTLTDDFETQLSRLGSSKWLYALTGGELRGAAVRAAAAEDAAAAAERFESWADEADEADESDESATKGLFTALAAAAEKRREAAAADVDVDGPPPDRRVHEALGDLSGPVERVGGALGYAIVLDRTVGQMVGFFVGDADPTAADRFRSIRATLDDCREDIVAALDNLCEADDWDRARSAAAAIVEAAYDDYVAALESMGVEPKSVC